MVLERDIRILFLAADPSNLTRTRLGEEYQIISDELQRGPESRRFLLQHRFSAKIEEMTRALMDFHPHIVHFSGHGSANGELCFEDRSGTAKKVRLKDLARLFALHARQVECVILNACYSGRQAGAISKHISYVIGLKELITEPAAHYFSLGFYQALSSGSAIEIAFEHACALLALDGQLESVKPVLKKRPSIPKNVTVPESPRTPDRSGQGVRGPPRRLVFLGLCALTVLVALGLSKLNTGDQTVGRDVEERRIKMPFVVDLAPVQRAEQGEANAAIRVLGVTLLPDGRLEVRGEVQPEQRTDLSTFHVEVTLDGESQVGFIDANTRTWKVFFEPSHSPVPGEKLGLKAVLVGRKQNAFYVQPAEPIS
jgi:hypothetical protein